MKLPLPLFALPTVILSACAGSEPTRDVGDVLAFDDAVAELSETNRTSVDDLPQTSTTGFVRYEGEIGANILLNGEEGYALLGDLQMDVGFAGARNVDGVVDDVNLLFNSRPQTTLLGELDISGEQASGKIDAQADGVLTRVIEGARDEDTNLRLDLSGTIRTDRLNGDTVLGIVNEEGSFGDGAGLSEPTFNVLLDGSGAFYGQAD